MKKVMLAGRQVTFRTKISNSKKQLAKIIHENGGWRAAAGFAVQDKKRGAEPFAVVFYTKRPQMPRKGSSTHVANPDGVAIIAFSVGVLIPNWHQTILSRDEYFHLYPAPDAVVVENKTTCHLTGTDKPTIEQLAAEYRNRKDYAERKQQEADAANADAEAKLAELVAAGKAVGLVSVVVQEHPFRVGDTVRLIRRRGGDAKLGEVGAVVRVDSATDLVVNFPSQSRYLVDDTDVELVSKGDTNA